MALLDGAEPRREDIEEGLCACTSPEDRRRLIGAVVSPLPQSAS
ncbi:hypothetical protein CZ774_01710 [Frigoribacterium sp. JB110]|nr:hypothetical protein CZ774_01710 [Frigoribacterium sp. JB110]